jgi:hypothetical protein
MKMVESNNRIKALAREHGVGHDTERYDSKIGPAGIGLVFKRPAEECYFWASIVSIAMAFDPPRS